MKEKEENCIEKHGISTMYHVTYMDNLGDILEKGLIPQIGKNSKYAGEPSDMVYLCDKKDVGYWLLVLGADVVLEVDGIDRDDCSSYEYAIYSEFLYRWKIKPDRIKIVDIKPTKEQVKKLCFQYIGSANMVCWYIAEHYYGNKFSADTINYEITKVVTKLKSLDFSNITDKEIREFMKFSAEEAPGTMCDEYFSGGERLWEMLIKFPEDETFANRKELYYWIKNNISGGLDVDTGTYGV